MSRNDWQNYFVYFAFAFEISIPGSPCRQGGDKKREPGIEIVAFAALTNQNEDWFLRPKRCKSKIDRGLASRSFYGVLFSLECSRREFLGLWMVWFEFFFVFFKIALKIKFLPWSGLGLFLWDDIPQVPPAWSGLRGSHECDELLKTRWNKMRMHWLYSTKATIPSFITILSDDTDSAWLGCVQEPWRAPPSKWHCSGLTQHGAWHYSGITQHLRRPQLSILDAMWTVWPYKQKRGIVTPTTPATTGPVKKQR